ncbi:MAG: hypothetical protein ABW173_05520, partial [Sphingomonas sp.]
MISFADPRLPVAIRSGFPALDKAASPNHVLADREARRVAAIVKDMSEAAIDAGPVGGGGGGGAALSRSPEQLAIVRQVVASLDADAPTVEAILDAAKAQQPPLRARELCGHADHRPESEEDGVEGFVHRARASFDPAAFGRFAIKGGPHDAMI